MPIAVSALDVVTPCAFSGSQTSAATSTRSFMVLREIGMPARRMASSTR
jgi:hypothetical protein